MAVPATVYLANMQILQHLYKPLTDIYDVQENGRARLAGSRTFGKGIVQSLQELSQGGVAVTYARYETPLHHDIHKVGAYIVHHVHCAKRDFFYI